MKQSTGWLQPQITGDQAERKLTSWMAPWHARLSGRLSHYLTGNHSLPRTKFRARMELAFMPCAVVQFSSGKDNPKPAWPSLLVNGYAGTTTTLHLNKVTETPGEPDAMFFHYPLLEQETLEIAQQHLLALQLRRILKLSDSDMTHLHWDRVVQYPFWVRYQENARGIIRFEMLDALFDQKGGTLVRQGFLQALDTGQQQVHTGKCRA